MTLATHVIDDGLTLQDKVRYHLRDYGTQQIPVTIEELSTALGRPKQNVYQVINILAKNNEIELEKDSLANGREKIVGIKLIRLQPTGRTYTKRTDRSGPVTRILPEVEVTSLDNLAAYLEQKLAIEDMKDRAKLVGLDESVISFEVNPIAEEGILALKMYSETKEELEALQEAHRMRGYDLEAAKRDILYLKKAQETQDWLKSK